MGSEADDVVVGDGEGPERRIFTAAFYIDVVAVTNANFATFVKATGYVTQAEQLGWSFVFDRLITPRDRAKVIGVSESGASWWCGVKGADWRHPEGAHSGIGRRSNHPVVHVSWIDASAYAEWTGKRLPTEAEWENAARGGLSRKTFPWGNEFMPKGRYRCNTWQGLFPHENTREDGYLSTAPVNAYDSNGFGLYNMVGNTWEWCADWFSSAFHRSCRPDTRVDPQGPPTGAERVMKGGSYLCHASYCNRYRVSARTSSPPDTTTGHLGFRCAMDA